MEQTNRRYSMSKVSILGAGSWGTALALLLYKNGHEIIVWSAIEAEIKMLNTEHEHKEKLPGVKLPEDMRFTTNLEEAVKGRDLLVLAVPSPFTRSTAHMLRTVVEEQQIILDVAKGVEENTLYTLSQIIKEEVPQANVAVLSGPSHAEEVGKGIPTTCVVGSHDKKTAEFLQNIFMNEVFRVYTSNDVLGIELGGALKNVVALAAGIADGLGYGDNTKAALITRGIAEITRLGVAMGGKTETFYGLTGIGDLIVTCASMHSRNRRAGILIGKGSTMQEAMEEVKMVVEGVYSTRAAVSLAEKYHIEMPIIEQVNAVLFENKPADEAVRDLMIRDKKIEHSDMEW
jgi:glycerol-3-phosphate dehydrogenase (NAD(P)+)